MIFPWRRLEKCIDKSLRVLEPIFALFALTMVFLAAFIFFKTIYPEMLFRNISYVANAHFVWAVWLLFNIYFNQGRCMLSNPGTTKELDQLDVQVPATAEWRFCFKCNLPKPPLTHHCSVCQVCVLNMDHHCPWLANCIGYRNLKFFYLFLFYMWIGSGYCSIIFPYYIPIFRYPEKFLLSLMIFVLSVALFIALAVLLGLHTYLIIKGESTIDCLDNCFRKKVDHRHPAFIRPVSMEFMKNWKNVFNVSGPFWWVLWLLPDFRTRKVPTF